MKRAANLVVRHFPARLRITDKRGQRSSLADIRVFFRVDDLASDKLWTSTESGEPGQGAEGWRLLEETSGFFFDRFSAAAVIALYQPLYDLNKMQRYGLRRTADAYISLRWTRNGTLPFPHRIGEDTSYFKMMLSRQRNAFLELDGQVDEDPFRPGAHNPILRGLSNDYDVDEVAVTSEAEAVVKISGFEPGFKILAAGSSEDLNDLENRLRERLTDAEWRSFEARDFTDLNLRALAKRQ